MPTIEERHMDNVERAVDGPIVDTDPIPNVEPEELPENESHVPMQSREPRDMEVNISGKQNQR